MIWTLTTNGKTERAYASLKTDYQIDNQVISTEVGGDFGSLRDELAHEHPAGAQGRRGAASDREGRRAAHRWSRSPAIPTTCRPGETASRSPANASGQMVTEAPSQPQASGAGAPAQLLQISRT